MRLVCVFFGAMLLLNALFLEPLLAQEQTQTVAEPTANTNDAATDNLAADTASDFVLPAEEDIVFQTPEEAAANELLTDNTGSFWNVFFVLIAFILIVIGIIRLFKKSLKPQVIDSDFIRLVTTKQLRGDAYIHVLEVGNEMFLLGSGSTSVINQIKDDETVQQLRLVKNDTATGGLGDFQKIVQKYWNVLKEKQAPPQKSENSSSEEKSSPSLHSFKDRMDKLK